MKNKIFLTFLISFIFLGFIQAQDTTYFDKDWIACEKQDASFYRLLQKNGKNYTAFDYYKNGQLQMKGTYSDEYLIMQNGPFEYYYKNGKLDFEGIYKNGQKEGEWKYYYENGKLDYKGTYKNGLENGEWRWYFKTGEHSSIEMYKNGLRTEARFFNKKGQSVPLEEAEILESYPGGQEALLSFLSQNITYPQKAKENGIEGIVIIKVIINKQGNILDYKFTKKIHSSLDNEALRVVKLLTSLKPRKRHNRMIDLYYLIPISFTLD